MPEEHKTVFISYRRNVASFIARAIFLALRVNGYDVFMDVESIDSGTFDTIILNQIEARAHFVLILTPGTLDRVNEPGDWLRREIEYALDTQRNIVPLVIGDFTFKGTEPYLTGKLSQLSRFNGVNVPHDYFDEAMVRLRTRFLKQPVYGAVRSAPASDQAVVERKIEEVAAQPAPTEQELSAEEYFIRGLHKQELDEIDEAIVEYDKALTLNPEYAQAYYNRGIAYYGKEDFDRAIADFSEAIRIDPHYFKAYFNRGGARDAKGDFDGAIADYDAAVRLDPLDLDVYSNRGLARYRKGDYNGAIADCTHAINSMNPVHYLAYNNRGEAFFALGNFAEAYKDFQEANDRFPTNNMTLAGLGIAHYALGRKAEAKRNWRALLAQDQRYGDADWVGSKFEWVKPLTDAARKLIAEL